MMLLRFWLKKADLLRCWSPTLFSMNCYGARRKLDLWHFQKAKSEMRMVCDELIVELGMAG